MKQIIILLTVVLMFGCKHEKLSLPGQSYYYKIPIDTYTNHEFINDYKKCVDNAIQKGLPKDKIHLCIDNKH